MRGTGGEFFLNLLSGKEYDRPPNYHKMNRYVFPDPCIEFQLVFQAWTEAIHNGFDSIDDYLFYKQFNQNLEAYDRYKNRYPGKSIYEVLQNPLTPP